MTFEHAPIYRAFKRGERLQAARKAEETPDQRLRRENFKRKCEELSLRDQEVARKRRQEEKEKQAKRLAKKKKKHSDAEVIPWDSIDFSEFQANEAPLVQAELRRDATRGVGVFPPEETVGTPVVDTESTVVPKRPKKHKKVDEEIIRKLLEHYCYLRRNKRRKALKQTICFGQQLHPPVYVSKTTLSSWRDNPKYGVNKENWRLEDIPPQTEGNSKVGRPHVLDEETLQYLEDGLTRVRDDIGARVSLPMAQEIFKQLLKAKNKGHLVGTGPGQISISRTWTRNFMTRRMKWRYKAVTSCTKFLPKNWQDMQRDLVLQIALLVRLHNLTEVDVYNMDETCMLYNPSGKSKTWSKSGKIDGTDDYHPCEAHDHGSKQMISLVCAITANGERLPLQYIFEGKQYKEMKDPKTKRMLRRVNEFGNHIPQYGSCPMQCKPEGADFIQTSNHWANSDTTLVFFEEIVMKHAERRSDPTKPIIVIWDNASFHCTDVFRKALNAKFGDKIILCYLPTNTTSKLQPLDLSVNGAFKQAAKKRFFEVAADKCVEQLLEKNTAYHDLHLNVSKVSSAKLVEITQTAWDRLTHDAVISGWRKSGLLDIFSKEKQSEATAMSMNGELSLKCLNTNRGKAADDLDNYRPVLNVFGEDEDCFGHEWEESFCDNDTALDKDVSEEEIAEMLARMRTTARTQAFSRPG